MQWLLAPLILIASSVLTQKPPRTTAAEANTAQPPHASQTTTQPSDTGQPIPSNGHDAWELLWRFASGEQGQNGGGKDQRQTGPALSKVDLGNLLNGFDTDFIIATLADPIESHVPEDFDRSLEAIEAAMAASGYSLSRFDLPWRTPQEAQVPQERVLPDATLRPGVLLFFKAPTRNDPTPRLFLVFAVGETPTAGIHKAAFLDALNQANKICAVARCSRRAAGGPIRILGPTFSGSAQSLSMALEPYLEATYDTVKIISGSATAPNLASDFTPIASHMNPKGFETVVHDDKDTLTAVYGYFQEHCHALPKEFGILYEEGTGYGSASSHWLLKDKLLTAIPFPFGIYELQTAAPQSQTTPQPPQLNQSDDTLYPVLTPENAGRDIVPAFSSLKKAIADRVLSSDLETVAEMNLKYVGIIASNVKDTVFLAQQIRTHIPNIVVFVLDNDALYLNSEVVNDLTGMLVASTYPLFPTSQLFSGDRRIGFIFSSQQQEGTYNAFLALLGDDSEMLDYYKTISLPVDSDKPPVWLTVVGSTEFWPIGAIDASETSDAAHGELHSAVTGTTTAVSPSLNDGLEPRILKLVLLTVGALCIYVSIIRLFAGLGLDVHLPSGALREVIPPFGYAHSYYTFALLLILGEVFALSALAVALPLNALSEYFYASWWIQKWIMLVAIALVPICVDHGLRVAIEFAREKQFDERFAAFIAAFMPLAWLGLLLWFGVAETKQQESSVSWLDRAAALRFTNIESGISTFRPLFLIGLAALCVAYGALRRLKLGEQLFTNPGTTGPRFFGFEDSPSFQGLRVYEDHISGLIRMISLGGKPGRAATAILIVLALVVVWWLFRPLGNQPFGWPFIYSFEVRQFNWLFIVAFLAVYLEIAHSAVRCALCWHYFHALLRRLSQSPLVEDFARIGGQAKDDQDSTPRLQLSMPEATFTSLFLSVGAADEVAQCDAVAWPIRQRAKRLKTEFDTAIKSGRSGCADMVRAMAGLSAEICSYIEPFSPLRLPANPTLESEQAMLCCRRFLATRVVHYCWIMMVEFRNWFIFTGSGLFLMLMAVSSYPFINDDYLLRFSWVALLAAVSLAVSLLVQINRDKVLSLLSGGTPGRIDWNWDFFSRLLIYGVLPILGLLGIQFPATLSGISHLIQTAFGGAAGLKG
jgi:hypothetical protein